MSERQTVRDLISYIKEPDCAEKVDSILDMPVVFHTGATEFRAILSTYAVKMGDGSYALYIDLGDEK